MKSLNIAVLVLVLVGCVSEKSPTTSLSKTTAVSMASASSAEDLEAQAKASLRVAMAAKKAGQDDKGSWDKAAALFQEGAAAWKAEAHAWYVGGPVGRERYEYAHIKGPYMTGFWRCTYGEMYARQRWMDYDRALEMLVPQP